MPAFTATAPGKIILFGEHAVVYGEPALAAPVLALEARAVINAQITGESGDIWIEAPDINLSSSLTELGDNDPLRAAIAAAVGEDQLARVPACRVQILSSIPPSSGLGSSAAVSAALIRAFSAFLGKRLSDQEVSRLTFEVEKIQHGTPSGIDNNVVVFQQPVFFQTGSPLEILTIGTPFEIMIADSGERGDTHQAVNAVRRQWEKEPEKYQEIFTAIGKISTQAKALLGSGSWRELGPLMNQNQALLRELGVSSPKLDHLVDSALDAGALGAKLSGGGLGGHLIVLADKNLEPVKEALLEAGAEGLLKTPLGR